MYSGTRSNLVGPSGDRLNLQPVASEAVDASETDAHFVSPVFLYVGVAGDVVVDHGPEFASQTWTCVAGMTIPVPVVKVHTDNTTASGLRAMHSAQATQIK